MVDYLELNRANAILPQSTTNDVHLQSISAPLTINQIPPEILGMIFCVVVEENSDEEEEALLKDYLDWQDPDNEDPLLRPSKKPAKMLIPLRLSLVCLHWRSIALSMPSLWTNLEYYSPKVFDRDSKIWTELLKLTDMRSGDQKPWNVCIELDRVHSSSSLTPEQSFPILDILTRNSHRWEQLTLFYDPGVCPQNFSSLAGRLPVLKHLCLGVDTDTIDDRITTFRDAPNLRSVELFSVPPSLLEIPWSQLTELSMCTVEYTKVFDIIQMCTELRCLRWKVVADENPDDPALDRIRSPHAKLETLELNFLETGMVDRTLNSLELPSLQHLILETSAMADENDAVVEDHEEAFEDQDADSVEIGFDESDVQVEHDDSQSDEEGDLDVNTDDVSSFISDINLFTQFLTRSPEIKTLVFEPAPSPHQIHPVFAHLSNLTYLHIREPCDDFYVDLLHVLALCTVEGGHNIPVVCPRLECIAYDLTQKAYNKLFLYMATVIANRWVLPEDPHLETFSLMIDDSATDLKKLEGSDEIMSLCAEGFCVVVNFRNDGSVHCMG